MAAGLPPMVTPTWTVRPGDNLWSIAASTLRSFLDRDPTDREISTYWMRVIELNRATLPIPSDPDLIFAGSQVRLPSLP